MSTGLKHLTYDGLRHFLEKLKSEVLSNYMPLNNYTFEYITNNETTNDIILHVNRANPMLFRWLVGNQEAREPIISNTGPIRAYSMYFTDLSVFTQQNLVITVGGEVVQTYDPFTTTPTVNDVFDRILSCIKQYNWSGYVHYTGYTVLIFTYWGTDTNMDLDISPAAGLLSDTIGDKYYDTILNYNEIYNRYTTGDTQSLTLGNVDLPLAFTQRTFDNISLQLFENSNFELIRFINTFGNNINLNLSTRQTSIIHSDINNKLIINNNLIPQDTNSMSLGDSDYMFSYVHAMDFVERGVMLRDTYLKKASELTYAEIDAIFTE